MLQGSPETASVARDLRGEMSLPEVMLWQRLRQRPSGMKFRRQHPSGEYVADFYFHEARLIVEVNGVFHDLGDRPARDEQRDAWFQERGLRVLRIRASDVLNDPDLVSETIVAVARSRED